MIAKMRLLPIIGSPVPWKKTISVQHRGFLLFAAWDDGVVVWCEKIKGISMYFKSQLPPLQIQHLKSRLAEAGLQKGRHVDARAFGLGKSYTQMLVKMDGESTYWLTSADFGEPLASALTLEQIQEKVFIQAAEAQFVTQWPQSRKYFGPPYQRQEQR